MAAHGPIQGSSWHSPSLYHSQKAHKFNPDNPPALKKGDYLINGHTHIPAIRNMGDYTYINPGSVSIPKADSGHSYMIYENDCFRLMELI